MRLEQAASRKGQVKRKDARLPKHPRPRKGEQTPSSRERDMRTQNMEQRRSKEQPLVMLEKHSMRGKNITNIARWEETEGE